VRPDGSAATDHHDHELDDHHRAAGRVPRGRLPAAVTIRERSAGHWTVTVYAGVDPVTGRARRINRTVHGGKRAAQDLERRLKNDVRDGKLTGSDVTVAEAIDAWLARAATDLSPTTVHGYQLKIRTHVAPLIGSVKLSRLTPHRLDTWYGELEAKGLAPGSIRQCHAIVRRALARAVRNGWITTNPAAVSEPPKIPKVRRRAMPAPDTRRVIDAAVAADAEFGILVALAAATGARRGDLCGLRWRDVDLDAGTVRFVETLAQYGTTVTVKATKNEDPRVVALDPATLERLRAHRRRAVERAFAVGVGLGPEAYVATSSPDGLEPVRPDTFTQRFSRLVRRLDVAGPDGRPWRLHDLRHWHASTLLDAGVPLGTVSERLGHRDKSTTANIYSHALPATDQRAAEVIGATLWTDDRSG
jgi:integrase